MEMEMLNADIQEYRVYMEICGITLLFVFAAFLTSEYGMSEIRNRSILGYTILFTAGILLIAVIYMLMRIVYITKSRMKDVNEEKKALIRDWVSGSDEND